jgi:hypothetical protein
MVGDSSLEVDPAVMEGARAYALEQADRCDTTYVKSVEHTDLTGLCAHKFNQKNRGLNVWSNPPIIRKYPTPFQWHSNKLLN